MDCSGCEGVNIEFTWITWDMLENAEKAIRFVEGMKFEEFTEEEKTAYAVIRALEVIGEAVRKIPQDLRDMYPEESRR